MDIQKRVEKIKSELESISQRIPQVKREKEEKLLNCEDVAALNMEISDLEQKHNDLTTVLPKLEEELKAKELEARVAEIVKEAARCKRTLEEQKHKIEELRKSVNEEFVKYKDAKRRLLQLREEANKLANQGIDIPHIRFTPIAREINIQHFAQNKDVFIRRGYY